MFGTERKDDFYIKEIAVNLVNKAGVPVYLNNDITPSSTSLPATTPQSMLQYRVKSGVTAAIAGLRS